MNINIKLYNDVLDLFKDRYISQKQIQGISVKSLYKKYSSVYSENDFIFVVKFYFGLYTKEFLNKEYKCSSCNKDLSVKQIISSKKYCSIECSIKNKKEDIKIGCLKKYGVENVFQVDATKEKIKHHNLKKYGYEYGSQNSVIKEKIAKTNLKKYGCKCSLNNKIIKEKSIKTIQTRYGTDHVFKVEKIKNKCKETWKKKDDATCTNL